MNETKQNEHGRLSLAAASKFAARWKDVKEEKQFDQQFWHEFFKDICGIEDLRESGIEFQKKVISSKKGTQNYIDVFWKDVFLVEHKSAGKDLDAAEAQARDYLVSLPPALRPPSLIISDFARFRIVDVLLGNKLEFPLEELPANLSRIEALIALNSTKAVEIQVEADQKAAQLMADLYVELKNFKYEGHVASVFMVRILFCLFADDTRMWKTGSFSNLVKDTNPLGTDLGPRLATLFEILDTPKDLRKGPQDPLLEDFPYVNGGIFSERLETVNFNGAMRNALMNACMYDWSSINPTIFGALFQDIKSKDERRANGEHYTTEENIDKTIKPLFLDELHEKLASCWDNVGKLKELQRELGTYQILDPACGCGNFLVTTYKRLRQLELDIIVRVKQLLGTAGQTSLFDVSEDIHVKLGQLHGIEYVEWSAQIAKVAIYLTDHQENLKLETVLGVAANRFPLTHAATIIQGNALQIDWLEVCPMGSNTVIVGNPPFKGSNRQSDEQREDTARLWIDLRGAGSIDYVANWYLLAAKYMQNTSIRAAFVSTNSITQGEQPFILWGELYRYGMDIDFAHRTFEWSSDAQGKASVHCVIIGFSALRGSKLKSLWSYETPKALGVETKVSNINAYLAGGAKVLISPRSKPLSPNTPPMRYGNMPNEFGYLANIYEEDLKPLRDTNDSALKFIRPLIGASEMLNGLTRYCLWLVHASPAEMQSSRFIKDRVEMVKKLRSESNRKATVKLASTPYLFQEIREQTGDFLAVPIVSSETREYIPMKMYSPETVPTNRLLTIPECSSQVFSILQSKVFSVWVQHISGRLKNDFSLSAEVTYNNFPFPELTTEDAQKLADSAQSILEARKKHEASTLAEIYKPNFMPVDLRTAHDVNDKNVLAVFDLRSDATDEKIMSELTTRYAKLS